MAKRICLSCGNGFIGRAGAEYCSAAHRQRARRARAGAKCDSVTDTAPRRRTAAGPPRGGHCAEAAALLAKVLAELAENASDRGEDLELSAAEDAALDMALCAVDRKADLYARYLASDDDRVRVRLSGEIRLLETSVDRLLRRVNTDVPDPVSRVSQKASQAANVRWQRGTR